MKYLFDFKKIQSKTALLLEVAIHDHISHDNDAVNINIIKTHVYYHRSMHILQVSM